MAQGGATVYPRYQRRRQWVQGQTHSCEEGVEQKGRRKGRRKRKGKRINLFAADGNDDAEVWEGVALRAALGESARQVCDE